MSLIDDYEHLLARELRELWPLAAVLARKTSGRLMGGTALALHLQHRASEDLDIMTLKDFSGRSLHRQMHKHLDKAFPAGHSYEQEVLASETGNYFALIGGIKVDVFQARQSGERHPLQMKWLEKPISVDNVPVGSIPDILATKLDVIMYRPKLRDYIDVTSIDQMTNYSLEDGIEFYKRKFDYTDDPNPHILKRIVGLLADPGQLQADPRFETRRIDVLAHLERRAPQILEYIADTSDKEFRKTVDAASDLGAPRVAPVPNSKCGAWMPRARTHCALPPHKEGPHRTCR
ncbi:MAG: nucleotidyl transferase AbiEii/AbiGii toxin family protein [Acidimicrobiaceae bacterium]|nr:nucleotidyl transferase AbiEii/AbiGii toxin family protein [Acidimicrobiia bacterium]MCY4492729.1 nucleotidyl transferase AbiEii/AbiGii toxin family protein [Acidimicrobiaceae bacterium]